MKNAVNCLLFSALLEKGNNPLSTLVTLAHLTYYATVCTSNEREKAQMESNNPLKVLVVDDTVVYRKIVSDVLAELPDVDVVGVAHNGKIAMAKIASLKPDILTLDIEMPEMNGLEVLAGLKKEAPEVGAIMLSTLTQKGGDMTMKALELGAFDFIPKPQTGNMAENKKCNCSHAKGLCREKSNEKPAEGEIAAFEIRTGKNNFTGFVRGGSTNKYDPGCKEAKVRNRCNRDFNRRA